MIFGEKNCKDGINAALRLLVAAGWHFGAPDDGRKSFMALYPHEDNWRIVRADVYDNNAWRYTNDNGYWFITNREPYMWRPLMDDGDEEDER